jgi:uncharacterized repeat protein (TIGR03803 family)
MNRKKIIGRQIFVAIATFLLCASVTIASAQTESVIHSFDSEDGGEPLAGLIADQSGALYGTTSFDGPTSQGVVYKLTPPSAPGGAWTESILYAFLGTSDGSEPRSNLLMDSAGAIYGTTVSEGTFNCGTFFQLLPPTGGGQWTENTLHAFSCYQGEFQSLPGNVILNQNTGTFYGVVQLGGTYAGGYVYELAPSAGGTWNYTVLHNFNLDESAPGYANGCEPSSMVPGPNGVLYGTANECGVAGGTIFKLTPPTTGTNWNFTLLYTFGDLPTSANGYGPNGLVIGKNGVLYGTTAYGGSAGFGIVYSLTPDNTGPPWTETIVHSFTGGPGDGNLPLSGVILGPAGTLYGATGGGGLSNNTCQNFSGCGTVFQLTPSGGGWRETILHSFSPTGGDAINPNAGPLLQSFGNLYGATYAGGAGNVGTVYTVHP